ncbi:site-specific integrase [Ochrobactrum intermedium]|uniref:tyrosine-type recombinase/integrase n=1 Tax=Brucella intermedia TaxID=94625 RepID=UPI00159C490E|nr:site-specific integrase [Brucella intermedia]NVM41245.1 site-specific integrase [Brucella intermedia]
MPFLVSSASGLPLGLPAYWIVAHRRALGNQPNTLFNELRSLMYLYLWADLREIDFEERVRDGVFFSLSEIIDLVGFCGRYLADILTELEFNEKTVINLATRKVSRDSSVISSEKRNRLSVIRSFLEFSSADNLFQLQQWPTRWSAYERARRECLDRLGEYISGIKAPNRDDVGKREGFDTVVVRRLLEVVEPDHPENPFNFAVRFRNHLIVRLLVELGIRRGELLSLYVHDLDLTRRRATITLHRRPDDPNDDRREKAAVKTAARVLSLSERATELAHKWVVEYRAKLPLAKRNPFLIVSTPSGEPMSLSNVNKIFKAIRKRVPDLPADLSPHLLRHSWNDAFSEQIDRKGGISGEDEIKWRMNLMGWRRESTARYYLRRTTRRRANEVLSDMQDRLDIKFNAESEDH